MSEQATTVIVALLVNFHDFLDLYNMFQIQDVIQQVLSICHNNLLSVFTPSIFLWLPTYLCWCMKKNISRELTLKAVFKQNNKQGKFLASFYWLQPLNIKHFWRKTNADWIFFCFVLFIFMMIMIFVRLLGIFVTVSKMPWSKIS